MHPQDITAQLLDQLPDVVRPDSPDLDLSEVRIRLNRIERQQVLLYLARWLYDNEASLPHIAFELSLNDGQVYLEDDEICFAGDVELDQVAIGDQVASLVSNLDEMTGEASESMVEKLLKDLNRVGWDMPEAWEMIVMHSPTSASLPAEQWLGEHRAAWDAEQLTQGTEPTAPSAAPRPRM